MEILSSIAVVFFLLVTIFLVKKKTRDAIASNPELRDRSLFMLVVWLTLTNWFLAIAGERFGWDQVIVFVYFFVPAVIATRCKPHGTKADLLVDLFIICWMWIPNDFGFNLIFGCWGGGMFGYGLTAFTGLTFIMILFTGWRKVDLKLDWSFTKKDFRWILGCYLLLAALIIPVALKIGFIHWGVIKNPGRAALALVIWFAPALVEEIIFRGVIQRTMIGWFRPVAGIIITSVIFGFSHIDNKAGDYRYPNWWYVFFSYLAAQIGYGLVYHKTKKLQCSTTLHFLVDFTWVLLFRGGK